MNKPKINTNAVRTCVVCYSKFQVDASTDTRMCNKCKSVCADYDDFEYDDSCRVKEIIETTVGNCSYGREIRLHDEY